MLNKVGFVILLVLLLVSCAGGEKKTACEKMTGDWSTSIFSVSIDWEKGTYEGVSPAGQFVDNILGAVKEENNTCIFSIEDQDGDIDTIIAQLDGDSMMLVKEMSDGSTGIPVIVERD